MEVGILTWNKKYWCSHQLERSLTKLGIPTKTFSFHDLIARVGLRPKIALGSTDLLKHFDALLVRSIGRGSLEETIFRMDLLHQIQRFGTYILNPPTAIERAVDKFHALSLLKEEGLPVPLTVVVERSEMALKAFEELGSDVVIKPIFGSCGMGSTRISDSNIALRIFKALDFHHQVIYLQKFIPHNCYDLRIFVLGGEVIASMKREANSWKTNVSLGAKPVSYDPPRNIRELSVKAAEIIGCKIAGIDILESKEGPLIIEINSQPSWKGLQSVISFNITDKIASFILDAINKGK